MTLKGFILLCIAFYLFYRLNNFFDRKRRYIMKNGIAAAATVVNISKTGMELGTSYTGGRPLILTFELDGVSKRVVIDQDLDTREIPKVGDKVSIRIHPQDDTKVLIVEPVVLL